MAKNDPFESYMPQRTWGRDNSSTRKNLDKTSGWNTGRTRYGNLMQDKANKRVKKPTSSLFYYADGEARKITSSSGNEVKAKTVVNRTGGGRRAA